MVSRRKTVSSLVSWLCLATLCFALSTAAHAAIKLPGGGGIGGIGGGGVVFDPGNGGGGGGGGFSFHAADLEARGYVCRPYFDGLSTGKRCDAVFSQADPLLTFLSVYRCTVDDSCTTRAQKPAPGKVPPSRFGLWSFTFPAAAKFGGFGDVNGDGLADAIAFSDLHSPLGSVKVALSNGTNEFSQVAQTWATSFCTTTTQVCGIGDFDGDGRTDIFVFDVLAGTVTVATSNGSAFVDARVWLSGLLGLAGTVMVGDFNGDGADDLALIPSLVSRFRPAGSILVALSIPGPPVLTTGGVAVATAAMSPTTASAGVMAPVAMETAAAPAAAPNLGIIIGPPILGGPQIFAAPALWGAGLCPDPSDACLVGDFNGDHRADVARVRATGESYVALSMGTGFGSQDNWSNNLGSQPFTFRVADMNHDGIDDLVTIRSDGGLTVGLSDGTFFATVVDMDDVYCADPLTCALIDVNGDHLPDLIEAAQGALQSGDGTSELPGDTFVSLGGPVRGFPPPPPRPTPADTDGDGVPDQADNCILVANPDQADDDQDGIGNACEFKADLNGDGLVNLADLVIMRQHFFTNFAPADLNHDGVVNLGDVAILKREFLQPPPASSATVPPIVELTSPPHGAFFNTGTHRAFVAGFVRNVASVDGQLVIHSQDFGGTPVDTPLAIASDGYFSAWLPIDPTTLLNPIVAEATRLSTSTTGADRVVTLFGPSVSQGDLSPNSLGARVEAWQLEEFAKYIQAHLDLVALGNDAVSPTVVSATFTGPMTVDARPFSDLVTIDIGIPKLDINYHYTNSEFGIDCTFRLHMGNVSAHIAYNLEPGPDGKVGAIEQSGSPQVAFGSFSHDENTHCDILQAVFEDIKQDAINGVAGALRAPGPVDGKLDGALNSLDLSGALSSIGVTTGTKFRAVTEDVIGITFDLDTGFVASALCGTTFCHPLQQNDSVGRIFQTNAVHPPFPLLAPNGGVYDVALAISPDMLNQLLNGMMAGGELTTLLAGQSIDVSQATRATDPTGATLKGTLKSSHLEPVVHLVPTVAPMLTGHPGAGGTSTEVVLPQLLLQVNTDDGTDTFVMAVDLKGSVDVQLASVSVVLPPRLVRIRVHDLSVLSLQALHVPNVVNAVNPTFPAIFAAGIGNQVAGKEISMTYPIPSFPDFTLTFIGLTQDPTGGVTVFGNLDLVSGIGGVIGGGGVVTKPGGGVLLP